MAEVITPKEFWLVWNTKSWRPRKPHYTQAAAVAEAQRLAAQLPGKKLYVLRAEVMVQQTDHASDCAVHNGPALPAGECDCGIGAHEPRSLSSVEA